MSRQIDTSKKLSEFEVQYLRDRNRLPAEYAQDDEPFDDEELSEEGAWDEMTVPELKEELKERGLPSSGTRDELLARLHESEEE